MCNIFLDNFNDSLIFQAPNITHYTDYLYIIRFLSPIGRVGPLIIKAKDTGQCLPTLQAPSQIKTLRWLFFPKKTLYQFKFTGWQIIS